jgi:multidrug efflux pump subunit AcrA (membrane-fusion protein)
MKTLPSRPINRRRFLELGGAAAVLTLAGVAGCAKPAPPASDPAVDYYTCTMHPSVHLHDPGAKCPICGMNLVPVFKRDSVVLATSPRAGEFTVPVERQQQIGVTYARVTRAPLRREVRAAGVVAPDKALHWEFVARVDGYVQTLHVTSPGELVEKDQPLLTLYSPDLLTAERELVELLRMRDAARDAEGRQTAQQLIDSAERRLAQWNVTPAQIAALEQTRQPSEFPTLFSPFRGLVEAVPVDQGRNVKIGDGKVSLIDPFLDAAQRTTRVRIDLPNPDFLLRPAMFVNAVAATGGDREALTIPVGAVLPTGTRDLVFVDKGQGRLEPRAITIEGKYDGRYAVTEGLSEGERVVTSANFLIDAEAKVQGALQSFEEPAADGVKPEWLR